MNCILGENLQGNLSYIHIFEKTSNKVYSNSPKYLANVTPLSLLFMYLIQLLGDTNEYPQHVFIENWVKVQGQ